MAANWWDLLLTGLAGVSTGIGVVAALIRAWVLLWRNPDLKPGYLLAGHLKSLMAMRADTRTEGELAAYLDSEVELEKFRAASGIRANHKQMVALMKLFRLGLWEREEVRAAARYLKVSPLWPHPRLQFEKTDRLDAICALIVSVALTLSGALVWVALVVKLPLYGFLLGAAVFTLSTLAAGWVGKAYGDLRSAQRIKAYLDDNPHILQTAAGTAPAMMAAA